LTIQFYFSSFLSYITISEKGHPEFTKTLQFFNLNFTSIGYNKKGNLLISNDVVKMTMKAKILVVDDDPDLTNLVKTILEAEDYAVHSAESGEEALGEVPKLRPDLIILDIILPGIDGYYTCKILKTDHHSSPIPIIILSIKSSVENRIMGLNIGTDDYITKLLTLVS
jgi:two-component system response regulator MtrA